MRGFIARGFIGDRAARRAARASSRTSRSLLDRFGAAPSSPGGSDSTRDPGVRASTFSELSGVMGVPLALPDALAPPGVAGDAGAGNSVILSEMLVSIDIEYKCASKRDERPLCINEKRLASFGVYLCAQNWVHSSARPLCRLELEL